MSYLVLARKLRPTTFAELVGQTSTAQVLRNAVRLDRIAHAFLFTGLRGVGKTSCARILAKALNCGTIHPLNGNQAGVKTSTGEPCNACQSCSDIDAGIHPDINEIDAASNRGIEHIRELKRKIEFLPVQGRYKVYIIDEAHMLTAESFNALLKTLEEPPKHIVFILATTESNKILPTVVSRCQRYDFRGVPVATMGAYLRQVSEQEGIDISDKALALISSKSGGALRDALTSLDSLVNFCGKQIDDDSLYQVLGCYDPLLIYDLLEHIIKGDAPAALDILQDMSQQGISYSVIVGDLLTAIKDVSFKKLSPDGAVSPQHLLPFYLQRISTLAAHCSDSRLQQYFHLLLEVEQHLKRTTHLQICVEMAILRMARVEDLVGVGELLQRLRRLNGQAVAPAVLDTAPSHPLSDQSSQEERQSPAVEKAVPPLQESRLASHILEAEQVPPPPDILGEEESKTQTVQQGAEMAAPLQNVVEQTADTAPLKPYTSDTTQAAGILPKVAEAPVPETNLPLPEPSREQWGAFLAHLQSSADQNLIGFLRTMHVLHLDKATLQLATQTGALAETLSTQQIEVLHQALQEYFGVRIRVELQAEGAQITADMMTQRQKDRQDKENAKQQKIAAAQESQAVLEVLEFFPGARFGASEVVDS